MSVRGGGLGQQRRRWERRKKRKGMKMGYVDIQVRVGQSKHPATVHFSTQILYNYNVIIVCKRKMYSFKKGPAPVTEGHYHPSSILHDRWRRCKSRHILKSGYFRCPCFIFALHEPSGLSCRPSAITTTKQLRRFCHFQASADKDVTAGRGRSCRFLGDSWLTPWERQCRADDGFHTQQHQ